MAPGLQRQLLQEHRRQPPLRQEAPRLARGMAPGHRVGEPVLLMGNAALDMRPGKGTSVPFSGWPYIPLLRLGRTVPGLQPQDIDGVSDHSHAPPQFTEKAWSNFTTSQRL